MPRAAYLDAAGKCRRVEVVSDLMFAPGAIDGTGATIGATWDGEAWVSPRVQRDVPESVPSANGLIVLARHGVTEAALHALIDASSMSDADKTAAHLLLSRSTNFHRDSTTLSAIAALVGLTDDAIDSMFIEAQAIKP